MRRLRVQWGATQLAVGLGLSPQAVSNWKVVPLERVIEVEQLTNVPRETLRPDFHLPRLVA
jgi:DNA-binding transcriptional regulator YdaS (Cro superfamily)